MYGKIARLPRALREQLNRRLANREPHKSLLLWLNSLPEVQAILAAQFDAQPVTKQNLYEWSQHGFRNWQVRQQALEFCTPNETDSETSPSLSHSALNDRLSHWLALRYAAIAHTLTPTDDNPDHDLRRLRGFAADLLALRRADLYANRLTLEQKRFALLESNSQLRRESEFWQWTKRPDIQAKLHHDPKQDKFWRDTIRSLAPEVAAFLPPEPSDADGDSDQLTDPALLI